MPQLLSLAPLAALLLASASLSAQQAGPSSATPMRSQTSGFMVGANLNASFLSGWGQSGSDSGGGVGLRIGYGISRLLLFAGLDGGVMTGGIQGVDYGLGHGEAGARYSLGRDTRPLRPYVQATVLTLVAIEGEGVDEATTSGSGFSAGAGIEYFVRRSLAVDFGFSRSRGSFSKVERPSEVETGLDINYQTTRVTLGINWRP